MCSPYPWPANNWCGWRGASKPWLMYGGVHASVEYLNAHLHILSNQNTTPWSTYFGSSTRFAVENYRRFWGLGPVHGVHWDVVDTHMWNVLDWHAGL